MSNGNKSIWTRVLAAILALLMVGSMCLTVIVYVINMIRFR